MFLIHDYELCFNGSPYYTLLITSITNSHKTIKDFQGQKSSY